MITLISGPPLYNPVYNPIYIRVSSTKTLEQGFNFIFDVYINGSYQATDKLLPRPGTTECVYSPARILESYLGSDLSQNSIGDVVSTNCIDSFEIQCGEEYIQYTNFTNSVADSTGLTSYTELVFSSVTTFIPGDTVLIKQSGTPFNLNIDGVHTIVSNPTTNDLLINVNYISTTTTNPGTITYADLRKTIFSNLVTVAGFDWNGVIQYKDIPSFDYTQYKMQDSTSKFLTNAPLTGQVMQVSSLTNSYDDRASITFLNADHTTLYDLNVITYSVLGTSAYDIQITNSVSSSTNNNILHLGVGPYNINNKVSSTIINNDIYAYSVQLKERSTGVPKSVVYYYSITDNILSNTCSRYKPVRFMWLNPLGGYDYYTATLLSRDTIAITTDTFQKTLNYNYQVGDRGITVINKNAVQTSVINTDWMTESVNNWLNEMFLSTEVYTMDPDTGILTPITVDNSSVEIKKRVNDKLLNMTFNYTQANKINTQRN